jgi:hypothetical protein
MDRSASSLPHKLSDGPGMAAVTASIILICHSPKVFLNINLSTTASTKETPRSRVALPPMPSDEINVPPHHLQQQPPPITAMTASSHRDPQADGGGAASSSSSSSRSRTLPHWLRPITRPTRNPAAPSATGRRPQPPCADTQRRSSAPPTPDLSDRAPIVAAVTPAATTTRDRGGFGSARGASRGGGGGTIALSFNKVKEITEATAALKNQTRRVGSAGGESCIKRSRRAAAGFDDEDGEFPYFYVTIILIIG